MGSPAHDAYAQERGRRWGGERDATAGQTIDGVMGVESRLTYEYDDRAVSLGSRWPPERV